MGQAAAGGALVQVGGDSAEESLVLGYGDVVALSGDFFASHHCGTHDGDDGQVRREGIASDDLFELAAIPGSYGTKLGTRDEIICALKVMAVDGGVVDARFEPGGEFSDFRFTATAAVTEVERRVRDRFGSGRGQWGSFRRSRSTHLRARSLVPVLSALQPLRLSSHGLSPPPRGGRERGLSTGVVGG